MVQTGESDARVLQAAVERGLISAAAAVEIGARATIERPAELLLVSEGHLSREQLTTLAAGLAAARIEPPAILGNYRIIDKLGQGGMATVYRAEQLSLHRTVALKIIGPPLTQDQGFCDRFLREARLVATINHPNVITCFDAGQDKGFLYMALELVTGGDAGKAVTADGGRLDEKRALTIAADCCQGLIALAAAGLIHRDIKPANIFLCPSATGERTKLADLGLARPSAGEDHLTASGAPMGTPAFMSPEQANGEADLDIRSDIYALGATLYALLTGKSPYQGTTVWSVMAQVLKDPVPDPRGVQPAISNASASIVIRCLAKERSERYASPQQLLEDLQSACSGKTPKHAKMIPHPSSSWDPLAAAGPMPRHASREHPTVNIPLGPAPLDRPRDDLGIDRPGRGTSKLILSILIGILVVGLGFFATKMMPEVPEVKPRVGPVSVETNLTTLTTPEEDPLRPQQAPPDLPFWTGKTETAPVAAPPAKIENQQPEKAVTTSDVPSAVAPPLVLPVVETPSSIPVPVSPQPSVSPPPVVATAIKSPETTPPPVEPPRPVENSPPMVLREVVEIPAVTEEHHLPLAIPAAVPEPLPAATPAPAPSPEPVSSLASVIAYANVREKELNRNGFHCRVEVLPSGNVAVTILDKTIKDLNPLHGLKIERLDAAGCDRLEGDLSMLTDMPLRSLKLTGCKRLTSLRGIRNAPIEELEISGCGSLKSDLGQLTAAKLLGRLDLTGCRGLTSLEGLQNQALTELVAKDCDALTTVSGLRGTKLTRLDLRGCSSLTTLSGLEGLPLLELRLDGAKRIKGDLKSLTGAPLRVLSLRDCRKLTDLDGLQGAPLTELQMTDCSDLLSIAALKGCKLTTLDLSGCTDLQSLDGLQKIPLVELKLYGCRNLTGDFTPVRGAPLQLVDASYCSKMTSLHGLEQSPLRKLILIRNTGLTDTTPLAGINGLVIEP